MPMQCIWNGPTDTLFVQLKLKVNMLSEIYAVIKNQGVPTLDSEKYVCEYITGIVAAVPLSMQGVASYQYPGAPFTDMD